MTGALVVIGAIVVIVVLSIGVGSIFEYFRQKELDNNREQSEND